MSHTCHAADCTTIIPPKRLMCLKRWRMVPHSIQKRVWSTYRPGQCDDWQPSAEYCDAAQAAVLAVAKIEGKSLPPDHPALMLYDAFRPKPDQPITDPIRRSPTPMSKLNLIPLHLGDILTEGGGAFGPTSFEGFILDAAFTLHRMGSHPPTEEQQTKMLASLANPNAPGLAIAYTVSLWVKFHVTNVLDPADWDGETFEHTWSLGGKSAASWYVCGLPDPTIPAGLKGGFDEQKLLAVGWYEDNKGKHVLWLSEADLGAYHGRWFQPLPDVPEAKRKLNTKSGYSVLCTESAPVVAAVDPALVSSRTEMDEKTKLPKVIQFLDCFLDGPDGEPLGADYFKGLSGIWDTKPVGTFQRKGEKEAQTQKVLCLTTYTGRVSVSQVAGQTVAGQPEMKQAGAGTTAVTAAKTTKKAATPATTTGTPATTVVASSGPNGALPLEARIKGMIYDLLPTERDETTGRYKGVNSTQFKLTVFKTGQERGVFPDQKEISGQGIKLYEEILQATPSPDDAAIIGAPDGFVFNPTQKVIERWDTEGAE